MLWTQCTMACRPSRHAAHDIVPEKDVALERQVAIACKEHHGDPSASEWHCAAFPCSWSPLYFAQPRAFSRMLQDLRNLKLVEGSRSGISSRRGLSCSGMSLETSVCIIDSEYAPRTAELPQRWTMCMPARPPILSTLARLADYYFMEALASEA